MDELKEMLQVAAEIQLTTNRKEHRIFRYKIYQFLLVFEFIFCSALKFIVEKAVGYILGSYLFSLFLTLGILFLVVFVVIILEKEKRILKIDLKIENRLSDNIMEQYTNLKNSLELSETQRQFLQAQVHKIYMIKRER